jgi:large subunit ribosomal protein L7/L12
MAKKTKTQKENKKLSKIIDEIADLSVLELSELVTALEDKFGVEAVAATPAAASQAPAEKEEEKSAYDVVMTSSGEKKIDVIKALRVVKPDLGLKEAKDLTENVPAEILKEAKKDQAEEAKKKLEEAGASVELK